MTADFLDGVIKSIPAAPNQLHTSPPIIQVGSSIRLCFKDEDLPRTITIAYDQDHNSARGVISHRAALAQAILGAHPGERRTFAVADGEPVTVTILEVRDPSLDGSAPETEAEIVDEVPFYQLVARARAVIDSARAAKAERR
jgi:hypothetical protein